MLCARVHYDSSLRAAGRPAGKWRCVTARADHVRAASIFSRGVASIDCQALSSSSQQSANFTRLVSAVDINTSIAVEERVRRYRQSPVTHANHEDGLTNLRSTRCAIYDIIDGLHNG